MSIIKGLFVALKNQKVIPFTEMTPELHNQISSGLAKLMMAAKMTNAKLETYSNEESEKGVLGCCLIDPKTCVFKIFDQLDSAEPASIASTFRCLRIFLR